MAMRHVESGTAATFRIAAVHASNRVLTETDVSKFAPQMIVTSPVETR